ncbi:hypothetical protein CUV01_19010 (plasmid) [Paracoccus tegillarcae]|uniref:Uncharacterized protein n=1 Tax=Paracoccus tegillarcae TaxID=1529068 RepID=A0A2K9F2A3_9RHOB|nr:hypothetical protein CUV01_19010 [Paracoccus tegillarcae]
MYGKDLAKSFRAFRKKGEDHVRGELARFLAAQYRGGSDELRALVDKDAKPAIRESGPPRQRISSAVSEAPTSTSCGAICWT